MNTKYERLKKSLIANGIKNGIIIIGCAIGLSAAFYFHESSQDTIKKLTSKERRLKGQITQMQTKQERANNTLELYEKLVKDSSLRSLELNRKNISDLLNKLSIKYKINNLSIDVAPITEQKKEPFLQKTGTVITTSVSLEFDSSSDAHGFAFADEVLKNFSGYLNINFYSIQREQELTEEVIRELLKGGKTDFIQNKISFDWLGLRPNKTDNQNGEVK